MDWTSFCVFASKSISVYCTNILKLPFHSKNKSLSKFLSNALSLCTILSAGNGSYGVVFEVEDTQKSISYAMKVQQSNTDFQREIKIMGQMNSVQLVKLLHGEV